MKYIVLYTCLISLFFSWNNIVPLSAVASVLVILIPLLLYKKYKVNKIFLSLALLLSYFIFSTLFYYPESFLEYDFYRRDGNVFVTFAPLLVLSLLTLKVNIKRIFTCFIYCSTFINFLFLLIYFAVGHTIFFQEEGVYHFLFEAHNAAGGFLMILSAISIGIYLDSRKKLMLVIACINLIGLYATDSRGSILALIMALGMYYMLKIGCEKKALLLFVIAQLFIYTWLYNNAAPDFLFDEAMNIDMIDSNFIDRGGTVIVRGFYLWPRAIYLFLQSPILGIGFGSYNDIPYKLNGVFGFKYNEISNENICFSDAHAHNTFLNILAECGIGGLILLLAFIKVCNDFIKTIPDKCIFLGLYLALWSAVFSSVTEHRFFTPSQMIPLVILLGLSVMKYQKDLK